MPMLYNRVMVLLIAKDLGWKWSEGCWLSHRDPFPTLIKHSKLQTGVRGVMEINSAVRDIHGQH